MYGNLKIILQHFLYLHMDVVMPPGPKTNILGDVAVGFVFLGQALLFRTGFGCSLSMNAGKQTCE